MADAGTGWERDRRTHFDDIAVEYDRIRSGYPEKLFADIFDYAGVNMPKAVLEIGAGTGKATTPFLNAGYDVTAVEIGANMSRFLLKRFKGYKSFNVITTAFEDALLNEDSYDLIYAASAFHWVDAKIGCPKVFRLLRSGGTIALFPYNVIAARGEKLYEDIQAVYEKHYYDFYTTNIRPVKKTKEDFKKPSEILHGFGFEDLRAYGFSDISMQFYDLSQTFGAEEYIRWLDTMSDQRGLPDDNRAALYAGVRKAIENHGGNHTIDYIFQLYMGRKK